MKRGLIIGLTLSFALAVGAAPVSSRFVPDKRHQNPRLSWDLDLLARLSGQGLSISAAPRPLRLIAMNSSGEVRVEVRCRRLDEEVLARLRAAGLSVDHWSARWAVAVGWVAPASLRALAAVPEVCVIRPPSAVETDVGAAESQGDATMSAPQARSQFGVDGTGVNVGILSDSFFDSDTTGGTLQGTTLTGSNPQLSGDLPPTVQVLDNGPLPSQGIDTTDEEGAAMGELIHDVAPGSPLFFHSAVNSEVDFAQGILDLADAGCRVIVDDVSWYSEPMFQDGPVAQAVDQVAAAGVPYFSAAGNEGRHGALDVFRDINPLSNNDGESPIGDDELHDWTGKKQAFARITVPVGQTIAVALQWAEPFSGVLGPGSQADFDIYLFEAPSVSSLIAEVSFNPQGREGVPFSDPFEFFRFTHTDEPVNDFYLVIHHYQGRRDVPFRVVISGSSGVSFDENIFRGPGIFGHSASEGGASVAAVFYYEVETGGNVFEVPNRVDVEPFSALGGNIPRYFDTVGSLLPGAPLYRFEPEIAAPDGCNTTFFGIDISADPDPFPNFFGTSAASPNAAGVAALMIDRAQRAAIALRPRQICDILGATATDVQDPGRDALSGYGLINALAAVDAVIPSVDAITADLIGQAPAPFVDLNGDGREDAADLVRRINLGP